MHNAGYYTPGMWLLKDVKQKVYAMKKIVEIPHKIDNHLNTDNYFVFTFCEVSVKWTLCSNALFMLQYSFIKHYLAVPVGVCGQVVQP